MYDGRYLAHDLPKDRTPQAPFAALLARDDWPVLVGLPALAALFVFAIPHVGWWALAIGVVVYSAGFVSFMRARKAHQARDELATTLGRLPEIEGTVRTGHAERTATLAKEMAHGLHLDAVDLAVVHAAGRVRSAGWVGRDELPHVRPGYDHYTAARWSSTIVASISGFERVAAVVAPAGPDDPADIVLMRSLVETAASYDDATEGMGLRPEDAVALLEGHPGGPERGVTDALREALDLTEVV